MLRDSGAGQLAIAGTIILHLVAPARADCGVLQHLTLADRQLYYSGDDGRTWNEFNIARPQFANQTLDFIYVIREQSQAGRAGVIIIKSARTGLGEPSVPRRNKNVELVRNADNFDNGTCATPKSFGTRSVSAQSYDNYHDYALPAEGESVVEGRKIGQQAILDDFHIKYAGRRGGCRETNNLNRDTYDNRTNRGQFSFNQGIVKNGVPYQLTEVATNLVGVSTAIGQEILPNLFNQRVEMRRYRSKIGQPACIKFKLLVPGPGSFLRINDLEALKPDDRGTRFLRADEAPWTLTQ